MPFFKKFAPIQNLVGLKSWLFLFVLIFLSIIFESVGIALIFPILDLIITENIYSKYEFLFNVYPNLTNYSKNQLIIIFISIFLIFFFLRTLYLIFFNIYKIRFITNIRYLVTQKVFEIYINKNFIYFTKNENSKIIRNLTSECSYAVNLVNQLIALIVESLIVFSVMLILIYVSSTVTLILFFMFGLIFIVIKKLTKKKINKLSDIRFQSQAKLLNVIQQFMSGIKEIIIDKKQNFFIEYFRNHNILINNSTRYLHSIQQIPRYVIEFAVVVFISIFIYLNLKTENTFISIIPFLGLFTVSALRILPSINRIIISLQAIKFGIPAINEVNSIILSENNFKNNVTNVERENSFIFKDSIEIKKIKFSYNDVETLSIEDFLISKGSVVSVVGENGSGKTTLINILTGLIAADAGNITIDGKYIDDIKSEWQDIITYIPQEPFLINESIKRNIILDKDTKVEETKFKNAVNFANLNELLEEEKTSKIEVKESGKNFSGGQKQKISIARSIYKNSQIIFMDEPTNSLDVQSKQILINFIKSNKGKITFIIISHDSDIVDISDKTLNLSKFKK